MINLPVGRLEIHSRPSARTCRMMHDDNGDVGGVPAWTHGRTGNGNDGGRRELVLRRAPCPVLDAKAAGRRGLYTRARRRVCDVYYYYYYLLLVSLSPG